MTDKEKTELKELLRNLVLEVIDVMFHNKKEAYKPTENIFSSVEQLITKKVLKGMIEMKLIDISALGAINNVKDYKTLWDLFEKERGQLESELLKLEGKTKAQQKSD